MRKKESSGTKKKKKVGETLEGLAGLCKGFGIYLEYDGKTRL